MNVVVTSAASPLGEKIGAGLAFRHRVRLTDRQLPQGRRDLVVNSLSHDQATNLLVAGQDAMIVVGEPLPNEDAQSYLDIMTRGLYNLLWAAAEEKVKRVIYLSTLDQMAAYADGLTVTERFRPRPTTEPHLLGKHLGEYVCREFARERKVQVVVLRIGHVPPDDGGHADADPMGLELNDLVHAIDLSLSAELPRPWTVVHVQGNQPGARFAIGDARRHLGFVPGGAEVEEGVL
jgi:nucleoside-diphosphate-sugar epimerase